jgi:hypothetical protein
MPGSFSQRQASKIVVRMRYDAAYKVRDMFEESGQSLLRLTKDQMENRVRVGSQDAFTSIIGRAPCGPPRQRLRAVTQG